MKRGELWIASGGVYAAKPRPAVIVQDDAFDGTDSVALCPLTSHVSDNPLLRVLVEPGVSNGLLKTSFVQVDKVTTVRRSQMGDRIGVLSRDEMTQVERSLVVFLGIAR